MAADPGRSTTPPANPSGPVTRTSACEDDSALRRVVGGGCRLARSTGYRLSSCGRRRYTRSGGWCRGRTVGCIQRGPRLALEPGAVVRVRVIGDGAGWRAVDCSCSGLQCRAPRAGGYPRLRRHLAGGSRVPGMIPRLVCVQPGRSGWWEVRACVAEAELGWWPWFLGWWPWFPVPAV